MSTDDPLDSDSEAGIEVQKRRPAKSALDPLKRLPYRRSNASLSNLFASTSSLPTLANPGSPRTAADSGTGTPTTAPSNGSVYSPPGSTTVRSASPAPSARTGSNDVRDLILRAFSPHVSVLASQDTEEIVRHKGISGGLLELLRPFGEHISGKVTIRDSTGVSRSWDDFSVRFVAVKDGLDSPRTQDRKSVDSGDPQRAGQRRSLQEFKPSRLRSGGDVPQIEDLVERHLTFSEEQSGPAGSDYVNANNVAAVVTPGVTSPFYTLYLRRMLSGLPLIPAETISHPVASVIAISSRSTSPIEELRSLYDSSNTGEHRLPQWVHNEFLRYYVLIHDEDYDDITKSMALYDQMKRHFGLHCHLLRLRSTQCVPSDDDSAKLPQCEWSAAAEEIAEITRRETTDDGEDPTPYIFESDAAALRAFVREMVTQSIVPSMERASATWNDQVASRRRGLSGRFMSLSKRFTAFGGRNSSGPALGGAGSNYDGLQGFYRPEAPEAVMRKLADYALMLRDFKLAHSTYEILCQDFKNDKAWRYYAAANEMAAVSLLLATGPSNKIRIEGIDQYLETAYYSYVTRVGAPYNALRTLMLGVELLKMRGGNALDDAARWSSKILDDRLVGPIGHALITERIANCYTERHVAKGLADVDRRRKAAFYSTLAADAWLRQDKASQAEKCLGEAVRLYGLRQDPEAIAFGGMTAHMSALQANIAANRGGLHHIDGEELLGEEGDLFIEPLQEVSEQLGRISPAVTHRKSLSIGVQGPPALDPLGAVPGVYEVSGNAAGLDPSVGNAEFPSPVMDRERRDDGFE